MKRIIIFNFYLMIGLLTACSQSTDFAIVDEEIVDNTPDITAYIDEIQSVKSDYKGYKIFDTVDDQKIVVISSGEPNQKLNVHNVEKSSKDTSITIVQTDLHSEQNNSYVVVKLDEIVGAFYVFERVQYEGANN